MSDEDDYEGPSGHYEDFGLAVVVVALAFGVVARTVCGKSVKVGLVKNVGDAFSLLPYTVWLLLFGVLLGCINLAYPGNLMHSSIEAWTNVDAHVLIFMFLPVLLFQSAFSMDPHIMRHEALQIFCLAVPGVVFSAVAIGIFSKFLIPTFSWNISLFFGSILSATDPVAVVALLKEMGVDERLGTLIEGEALMNDGSAYVMFVIFARAITCKFFFHFASQCGSIYPDSLCCAHRECTKRITTLFALRQTFPLYYRRILLCCWSSICLGSPTCNRRAHSWPLFWCGSGLDAQRVHKK